jgi:hypothetical protein
MNLPTAYVRNTIAGQDVLDVIAQHKAATVLPSKRRPGCLDSETLCAHQRRMAGLGFIGAEIVPTIRGYSLRYDSGLQDWGLIVRGLATYEDAVVAAMQWQAKDPSHRYVTHTEAK